MEEYIIGIDLGGTSAKMAFVKPNGEIVSKWSIPSDTTEQGSNVTANIIQSIQTTMDEAKLELKNIKGIGMGTPGSVDHQAKTVIGAYNLNWRTLQPIGRLFNDAFNVPFYLENDANVAALGEQWQGAGDNDEHVVMLTLGTGVGGGVIIDGKILHGSNGAAGEVGHLAVAVESGIACTCGKIGCLEAVASATGIVNLVDYHIKTYEGDTILARLIEEKQDLSAKNIFEAAVKGDEFSLFIVDRFAYYLGLAASHLANTLNPSKIVLGGGVSQAGEFLRSKVEQYCIEYTFPPIRDKTEIVLAQLGNDAGIIGAARLVTVDQSTEEFID